MSVTDIEFSGLEARIIHNPVGENTAGPIAVYGGWAAETNYLYGLQQAISAVTHRSSAAIGIYDTLQDQTADANQDHTVLELRAAFPEDELIQALPARMLVRATKLAGINRRLAEELGAVPTDLVAHCSAGNVALTERYISQLKGEVATVPRTGVLLEGMLAEGRRGIALGKLNKRFEKLAAQVPEKYISLQGLQRQTPDKLGNAALKPLNDILQGYGLTLFLNTDQAYHCVFGLHDIAAPLGRVQPLMELAGFADRLHLYPEQRRFGHGYALVESEKTARFVGHLLAVSYQKAGAPSNLGHASFEEAASEALDEKSMLTESDISIF